MGEPLRLLVVDDHRLMRLGIRTALRSERAIEVVGEADGVDAGMVMARTLKPGVILLGDSVTVAQRASYVRELEASSGGLVVIFSAALSVEEASAESGLLSKRMQPADLPAALLAAAVARTGALRE